MSAQTTGRPAWLAAANRVFGALARAGLPGPPGFDRAGLVERAMGKTGLEDFGEGEFLQPLDRLLAALEREAGLTPVGRLATMRYLGDLLENRLRLVADRHGSPEIAAVEIERPLFILGLPRTGTTLLFNLVAQDPGVRVPRTWGSDVPVTA